MNQCVVCLENMANTVMYRCGHLCACLECALDLKVRRRGSNWAPRRLVRPCSAVPKGNAAVSDSRLAPLFPAEPQHVLSLLPRPGGKCDSGLRAVSSILGVLNSSVKRRKASHASWSGGKHRYLELIHKWDNQNVQRYSQKGQGVRCARKSALRTRRPAAAPPPTPSPRGRGRPCKTAAPRPGGSTCRPGPAAPSCKWRAAPPCAAPRPC